LEAYHVCPFVVYFTICSDMIPVVHGGDKSTTLAVGRKEERKIQFSLAFLAYTAYFGSV